MSGVLSGVIYPVYQPVFDLRSHRIRYYEALLRLYTDTSETLYPSFLQIAETTGMIRHLDAEMLSQVLYQLQQSACVIAANVSVCTIESAGQELLDIIAAAGQSVASRLVIEITETLPFVRRDIAFDFCEEVRGLGTAIALDDFGAGNFSNTDIEELRPHYVKLDGSQVTKGLRSKNVHAFADLQRMALIGNFALIAEKIDSAEKWTYLKRTGVEFAQGYYISRPSVLIRQCAPILEEPTEESLQAAFRPRYDDYLRVVTA